MPADAVREGLTDRDLKDSGLASGNPPGNKNRRSSAITIGREAARRSRGLQLRLALKTSTRLVPGNSAVGTSVCR